MGAPKLPFTFPVFVKYPLHAVLYILLAYFVFQEFNKKDDCDTFKETNKSQKERIDVLENKIDQLTWAVAVKSGVIDKLITQKDSTKAKNNENIN